MKLTLIVDVDDMDTTTLEWIESLMDKAREQGDVKSCVMTEVPTEINFSRYL